MLSVNNIANVFIDYFAEKGEENDLTNMKLNKLLYFAYGIYLARTGEDLFECEFKAYPFGPVSETIYREYNIYGRNPIKKSAAPDFKPISFSEEQKAAYIDTLNRYGFMSSWALSDLTHDPLDSPWRSVDWTRKESIPKKGIKKYFQKHSHKTIHEILEGKETYGRIDESGMLVLPADDEDKDDDWS